MHTFYPSRPWKIKTITPLGMPKNAKTIFLNCWKAARVILQLQVLGGHKDSQDTWEVTWVATQAPDNRVLFVCQICFIHYLYKKGVSSQILEKNSLR